MWRKIPLGFKVLLALNLFSLVTNLLDFYRYAWVTYFLSYPAYPPFSFGVIIFDLVLAIGALLAILTRERRFWKLGLVYYGINVLVNAIILIKLLIGPKSGQMGLLEFQLNLVIYGLILLLAIWMLRYYYSNPKYFNKK